LGSPVTNPHPIKRVLAQMEKFVTYIHMTYDNDDLIGEIPEDEINDDEEEFEEI
jgi:hypothetical protein